MINELQLISAVESRLNEQMKAAHPLYQKPWTVSFPAKPESITGDIIRVQHSKGLYSVRYMESESNGNAETLMIGVYIWATTPDMESKLARAAKLAISNYSPGGCSALQFVKDEPVIAENGVMVRTVSFATQVPVERNRDPVSAIAALNL